MIAKGAIVRILRRDSVKTTIMSHSIGFAWEEQYQAGIHSDAIQDPSKVSRDPLDGEWVVQDRIKWLFKAVNSLPLTSLKATYSARGRLLNQMPSADLKDG